jgi:excisionase family DNA binding protein
MPRHRSEDPRSVSDLSWLNDEPFVPTEPVRAFLSFLATEAAHLRSWVPNAGVADALDRAREQLTESLRAALAEEAWLTVTEAAGLARVSPDAVRDWIRKGKVQSVQRAGGTYLVERRSLVLACATSRRALGC